MTQEQELESEIGKHMLMPENYGILDNADGIGASIDNTTQLCVMMYLKLSDTHVEDVMFTSNASEDVNTLGSLFTEMIKGDELVNVLKETLKLEQDLQQSYADLPQPEVDLTKPEGEQVEHVSTMHQDAANLILTAFRAAMRHKERKDGGVQEEHFEMNIVKSCPYSGTQCHFNEPQKDS